MASSDANPPAKPPAGEVPSGIGAEPGSSVDTPQRDATDFSLDSSAFEESSSAEPPLILDGDAASTNLSNADPSSGTINEPLNGPSTTIDLPSGAIEQGTDASANQPASGEPGPAAAEATDPRTMTVARAPAYRPTRRPPMAVLRVYDDGSAACEEVRIRKTPFDIGRLDGELLIPHELQMSRRHVRIDRTPLKTDSATADRSLAEWTLTDLHSLNGTFFKRSRLQIRDHAEVLIGGELLRFDLPEESDSLRITRIGPGRSEEKVTVAPGTAWIGADQAKCLPLLVGNTLLDPCHLRLDADRRGRWAITDLGSTNGLWVRIESSPLVDGDQWQCGEQRFAFTLP